MQFQWYPGHMTKARRAMQEDIKLIDVIIELVDSRVPLSSKNPDIDTLANGKSRILLMNKYDLADKNVSDKWTSYYESKGYFVAAVNSKNGKGVKAVHDVIQKACKEKIERDRKRGILNRPIRAMIVGIPNVGKSTFIKLLLGLYRPDSGTIRINSQSVDAYCKQDMSRQFLYVGQEEIFLNETVEDYLHIITQNKGEAVTYLLKEYDIAEAHIIENEGKSLSVGQRKKLLIMKMLLRIEEASVLIVDEIEAGLDQETREKYEQLLNLIAKKKNKLILVVEHDPQGTIEFTKIMHFEHGHIVNIDNF